MSVQQTIKRAAGGTATARGPVPPVPVPVPAPSHPRLVTDITVEHGPVDLFGRFFLLADTAARQRGVSLSFGSYEELLEANRKNSATWKPITSMYDHRHCPRGLAADRAFCILGRNSRGDVVATHAARFFDFDDADTFHDVAASSRMFYDEPAGAIERGERCEVSAGISHSIRGRVLINGAVWYHPDYRKRQLAMIIPRISRTYAYTRWKIDYSMGLVMEGPTKGGVIASLGYPHREWDLRLFNAPNGNPRCCLAWMQSNELLADLGGFLAGLDTQVDLRVDERRAQKHG